jgi:hypothetical protein
MVRVRAISNPLAPDTHLLTTPPVAAQQLPAQQQRPPVTAYPPDHSLSLLGLTSEAYSSLSHLSAESVTLNTVKITESSLALACMKEITKTSKKIKKEVSMTEQAYLTQRQSSSEGKNHELNEQQLTTIQGGPVLHTTACPQIIVSIECVEREVLKASYFGKWKSENLSCVMEFDSCSLSGECTSILHEPLRMQQQTSRV